MKTITVILLFFLPVSLFSQNIFIQIEQHQGMSTFSRQLLSFDLKYSYEYGFSVGIPIAERIGLKLGAHYQHAGTASEIWFDENATLDKDNSNRQVYNMDFIQIPLDITLLIGEKKRFSVGIGGYYSFHMKSTFETDSQEGNISALNPTYEEMNNNDYGIRISPCIHFPISEKAIIELGILQKFGLYSYLESTRHFASYLTAGVRFEL